MGVLWPEREKEGPFATTLLRKKKGGGLVFKGRLFFLWWSVMSITIQVQGVLLNR